MESPVRQHPIVNPEHCAAILRRIVAAWDRPDIDRRREEELRQAIADAKALLGE